MISQRASWLAKFKSETVFVGFIFCKKFGTVLVVSDRRPRYLSFETCVLIPSPSPQFFFFSSPLFSSRWRRIRLPPLLYITLSSFCLCLPTDAAHKESWPPCAGRERTTEKISPHRCASPPPHSLSLNQPLFSFLFSSTSLPSLFYSRSAHRSQALPMPALQQNPYTFTQPTRGLLFFWLFTKPTCALKAPVGQK